MPFPSVFGLLAVEKFLLARMTVRGHSRSVAMTARFVYDVLLVLSSN